MKIGDRVQTSMGPGTIIGFEEHNTWRRIGVRLDEPCGLPRNEAWFYPRDLVILIP